MRSFVSTSAEVGPVGIVAVVVAGLLLDASIPVVGQWAANVLVWATLLVILAQRPELRPAVVVCLLVATAGEAFLSLVWGLYRYREPGIPLFVPPGHALLFLLGTWIAPRVPEPTVWVVTGAFALYALSGLDTFTPVLLALFVPCLAHRPARQLYATMFLIALLLELGGTALGTWTWTGAVPVLGLRTTNPPVGAGVFYCVLDLAVVAAGRARG